METMTEEVAGCKSCGETIYRYCHSQAGSLKAYAWTDIDPDGEDDPRYGTRCQYSGTLDAFRHHPESEDEAQRFLDEHVHVSWVTF